MTAYVRKPAIHIPPAAFQASDDTTVYWLSGGGFLIHCRDTNLIIDPVLMKKEGDPKTSEIGLPLKTEFPLEPTEIPSDCYVLYTHGDGDHLGPETAKVLAEREVTMAGTLAVFERLARLGVPPGQIQVLRTWEHRKLGSVEVESTVADHPWQLKDLKRGGRPYRLGECCGYRLKTPDGVLYFPGDTRLMEEHLRMEAVDLLALDVSTCEYHLNHTSAVVLANYFAGADLLPFHYGTYDCPHIAAHCGEPEEVFSQVNGGGRRGHILAPGEPFAVKRR